MDVNLLILRCYDQADWMHEFLQILLEKKLQFIESMKGAKFDLVETGGGAASSTVISPKLHEEFCLPYDLRIHDALHGLGFRVTYHTCGGTLGIEEHIVANGCDASETLAPKSVGGNQEPWDFASKIDGRVAMIGGVDQFNVVSEASEDRIRAEVHKLFRTVGSHGGYVCSLSDHFFETPVEKLQAYADAGRECEY
jgi:uroporphyrinogen-III decarboxylase